MPIVISGAAPDRSQPSAAPAGKRQVHAAERGPARCVTWKSDPEPRPGRLGSCCRRSPRSGGTRSASATCPRWSCGTAATSRTGCAGSGCSTATPNPRPTSRRTRPGGGVVDSGSARRRTSCAGSRRSCALRAAVALALGWRSAGAAPSHAVRCPAVRRQQAPRFAHSRSDPCVGARGARDDRDQLCCRARLEPAGGSVGAHMAARLVVRRGRGGDGERDEGRARAAIGPADYGGWPRSCSSWRALQAPPFSHSVHARDGGRPAAFLASRLPGCARPAAAPAPRYRGFDGRAHRRIDREREGRRLAARVSSRGSTRHASDPAPAPIDRLRRTTSALLAG
mgnify:CR=1 FL=1